MPHSVHNHPNGTQAKALQLLCHIIKREGQCTVPKSSLRNHPPAFLPTPLLEPPLPPKEAPPEVNQWTGLLGGLVAPTACLCPHCLFVSQRAPHSPSCRWLAASIVSLTGPSKPQSLAPPSNCPCASVCLSDPRRALRG